jgi:hypothetical protein
VLVTLTCASAQTQSFISAADWASVLVDGSLFYTPIQYGQTDELLYTESSTFVATQDNPQCTLDVGELLCAQDVTCVGFHHQLQPLSCSLYYMRSGAVLSTINTERTYYTRCLDCDSTLTFFFEYLQPETTTVVAHVTGGNTLSVAIDDAPPVVKTDLIISVNTPPTSITATFRSDGLLLLSSPVAHVLYTPPEEIDETHNGLAPLIVTSLLMALFTCVIVYLYRRGIS